MKGEIWKDIEGYEGLYQISNMGRVKSVERMKWCGKGYYKTPERILKARKTKNGYLLVNLWKDGKIKSYYIHRLVAQAFLDNPDNLPEVNHIDQDKTNNKVENLEFCDRSYNVNYGTRNRNVAEKLRGRKKSEESNKKRAEKLTNNPKISKPVIAIDKRTGLIVEFLSAHEAERVLGISQSNITKCCKGKKKSIGGFYWMYANNNDDTE